MILFDYLLSRFGTTGYFVEAGAHDGVGDSQTYALELSGWDGVCVEPSRAFDGLKASRRCRVDDRVLWCKSGENVLFRELDGNFIELSGIPTCFSDHWDRTTPVHREGMRKTVGLTDLLRQHSAPPVISFLSLDTEGSEVVILGGHDFIKFRFQFVSVEYNGVLKRRVELFRVLTAAGMTILPDDVFGPQSTNLYAEMP